MRSSYDPGGPGTVAASTMRGLLAATVLVGAVGLPPALLRGQGPAGGTVAGNVRLTTRARGTPLPANAYQPRSVGRQAPGSLPEIRNVVVYLRGASARGPLPVATHGIRQEGEAFHPRLGGQLTLSTNLWDVRASVVNSAPTRKYVINNNGTNPRGTPVFVAGGGITPRVGARLGLAFAHGLYATSAEATRTPPEGRAVTVWNAEGEWSFGYTKISGEVTRDRLETFAGTETAYGWFVQGLQTLTPRVFVAARQEGGSAPPLRTGLVVGSRSVLHATEATLGYRLNTDITFRGSFQSRKAYTRHAWDQQAGVSVVWAHRWW